MLLVLLGAEGLVVQDTERPLCMWWWWCGDGVMRYGTRGVCAVCVCVRVDGGRGER